MELKESSTSVLKLKSVYIESFNFQRKKHFVDSYSKPKITISKKIEANEDGDSYVSLAISIISEGEYTFNLVMVGIFTITETDLSKSILLEKNAVAILFPYLRSQITLLTSQPSFQPIVLPPININALFDTDEEKDC